MKTRKKGRTGRIVNCTLLTLLIGAGVSLLLYPAVSNRLRMRESRRVIRDYRMQADALDDRTYAELLEQARAYNERLAARGGSPLTLPEAERPTYARMLDITGSGVMGYIEIPAASVLLPIYHGTDDAVLQCGAGHLEGSSLPVGGENTHAVLSGHRGLPSARLFTDLDRLQVGDRFTIRVLRETLVYEVDDIRTVEPHRLETLSIEPGQDLCTLVTCTPYGINTHRLLVRGHRIA